MPEEFDPEALIASARAGEPDALGRLLERYRPYLTLLARVQIGRRLQSKADADDVVQDAFLEAHRAFPRFEGSTEPTLTRWLRQVLAGQLAHLVRRYFGARARSLGLEQSLCADLDSSSGVLAGGLAAGGPSPSEEARRRERAVLVADVLGRLPEDYREVVTLRQLEGLPFADIAARMGRTVDSIQKLWVRGLGALKDALEGAGLT